VCVVIQMSRRFSLHPGSPRRPSDILQEEEMEEEPVVAEEEVFDPEAAAIDGNPFPEEIVSEESTETEENEPEYESMTVDELRALCRARELPVSGTKAELIARLKDEEAPSEEAADTSEDAPSEEAALSSDDTPEGEVSESGENGTEEISQ